jgi:hypothetical protein
LLPKSRRWRAENRIDIAMTNNCENVKLYIFSTLEILVDCVDATSRVWVVVITRTWLSFVLGFYNLLDNSKICDVLFHNDAINPAKSFYTVHSTYLIYPTRATLISKTFVFIAAVSSIDVINGYSSIFVQKRVLVKIFSKLCLDQKKTDGIPPKPTRLKSTFRTVKIQPISVI